MIGAMIDPILYQPPPMKDGRRQRKRNAARSIAQAAGEPHYFTGLPCKHGHIAMRDTRGGRCMECARLTAVALYWKEPEKFRQKAADARAADPEAHRAAFHEYYWRDPEAARARGRLDYEKNREARRASASRWKRRNRRHCLSYMRGWHARNAPQQRAYFVQYRKLNAQAIREQAARHRSLHMPEYAAYERNRRARLRNADGSHDIEDVIAILAAQRHRCAYCRNVITLAICHVDHIIPLFLGGSNARSNLQCTCKGCNLKKNKKHPLDFARQIGLLL